MTHGTSQPELCVQEVLAAVLQVRNHPVTARPSLQVMLWQRAREPEMRRWSLPVGRLRADEDVETSIRRHLAEKVDVRQLSHVEQLEVFSAPARKSWVRFIATGFLGLIRMDVDPVIPPDTQWFPVDALPDLAFDHAEIILRARDRLRGKLSYTNIGCAIAPTTFTLSTLRDIYAAALGHPVDATNLQRVLSRRAQLAPTGQSHTTKGRPATVFAFTTDEVQVTDPQAIFRKPSKA